MLNNFDKSAGIARTIKWLSATLSAKRGLPMVIAVGLTLISLIVHIVYAMTGSVFIGIIGFTLFHVAMIVGFVGVLLSEPLGRG